MSRTSLVIFACSVLLGFIASQLNHYLAPLHVSLFIPGLLVVFPALRLKYWDGVWAVFLTGLVLDAGTAVPFGMHALLMLTGHSVLFYARDRLPREENLIGLFIAILVNLGIFLVISVYMMIKLPVVIQVWTRMGLDLVISQCFIAVIAAWFFALQERALEISGVSLRPEQRGLF